RSIRLLEPRGAGDPRAARWRRGSSRDAKVVAKAERDGLRLALDRVPRLLVVIRRLEWDPAVCWKVGLDPGMCVRVVHRVKAGARAVGAWPIAVDEADGDAERSQHVSHRRRVVLAAALIAMLRGEQEEVEGAVGRVW